MLRDCRQVVGYIYYIVQSLHEEFFTPTLCKWGATCDTTGAWDAESSINISRNTTHLLLARGQSLPLGTSQTSRYQPMATSSKVAKKYGQSKGKNSRRKFSILSREAGKKGRRKFSILSRKAATKKGKRWLRRYPTTYQRYCTWYWQMRLY